MKGFVSAVGMFLGGIAALLGIIATLMFAWGVWHGGTLKLVHWQVGPSPILGVIAFLIGWEIVATICFFVVAAPFFGIAALIPEKHAA